MTIRQLLTQCGRHRPAFRPEFDRHRLSLKSHDDYVRLYGARGPDHPPGRHQHNYGFVAGPHHRTRAGSRTTTT
ncbi:hypothetical protein [Rhodanobacter lindaniclasticus]